MYKNVGLETLIRNVEHNIGVLERAVTDEMGTYADNVAHQLLTQALPELRNRLGEDRVDEPIIKVKVGEHGDALSVRAAEDHVRKVKIEYNGTKIEKRMKEIKDILEQIRQVKGSAGDKAALERAGKLGKEVEALALESVELKRKLSPENLAAKASGILAKLADAAKKDEGSRARVLAWKLVEQTLPDLAAKPGMKEDDKVIPDPSGGRKKLSVNEARKQAIEIYTGWVEKKTQQRLAEMKALAEGMGSELSLPNPVESYGHVEKLAKEIQELVSEHHTAIELAQNDNGVSFEASAFSQLNLLRAEACAAVAKSFADIAKSNATDEQVREANIGAAEKWARLVCDAAKHEKDPTTKRKIEKLDEGIDTRINSARGFALEIAKDRIGAAVRGLTRADAGVQPNDGSGKRPVTR